jgi:hypothetical protein
MVSGCSLNILWCLVDPCLLKTQPPYSLHCISERGFTARGRGDLVLLRATDTPSGGGHDVARLQASSLSSTMAVVSAGLNKVETMIRSYSKKKKQENES